jgi:outer membrane protein assembly factor BamA
MVDPPSDGATVTVGRIYITGNRKTREAIILREISFKTGEQYPLSHLVKKFETSRKQLLNTSLFTSVIVAAKNITGEVIDIEVDVHERNYLFPVPYFRPVDRNLNQWLVEKHASLSRVNYGAKLYYNNATGNNDKLRLGITAGYTRQFSFNYDRLYFDKKMKWGVKLTFSIGNNHEVNYNTVNDKQVFIKDENDFVRNFSNTSVQFTYRPRIKTRHSFGIGFSTESISDTVLALNPKFFENGRKKIGYPGIYYNLTYFDLDYIPYPTKGYALDVNAGRSGFAKNMNVWQIHTKALAYWPVSDNSFISTNLYAGIKFPFRQPYFSQRMLGYGDVYMQGYEYFVVDGAAGGYLKAALNRRLFDFNIKTPSRKNNPSAHIPFGIFGKIFTNAGYVYNPDPGENSLSNTFLWSGGIGIDIVTWYDITVKLEWAFNSLGQNGLFLHRKTIF